MLPVLSDDCIHVALTKPNAPAQRPGAERAGYWNRRVIARFAEAGLFADFRQPKSVFPMSCGPRLVPSHDAEERHSLSNLCEEAAPTPSVQT